MWGSKEDHGLAKTRRWDCWALGVGWKGVGDREALVASGEGGGWLKEGQVPDGGGEFTVEHAEFRCIWDMGYPGGRWLCHRGPREWSSCSFWSHQSGDGWWRKTREDIPWPGSSRAQEEAGLRAEPTIMRPPPPKHTLSTKGPRKQCPRHCSPESGGEWEAPCSPQGPSQCWEPALTPSGLSWKDRAEDPPDQFPRRVSCCRKAE